MIDAPGIDAADEPGLVLRLDMDDGLGDGRVEDSSPNQLAATCTVGVSCPSTIAGVRGDAAYFDGSGRLLRVPYTPLLDTTTAFTVSVWLYADSLPTQGVPVAKPYVDDRNSWVLLVKNNPGPCFATTTAAGADPVSCKPGMPTLGRWVHYAGTWDGGTLRLFVDGLQVDEELAASIPFDAKDILIGADENDGAIAFPWLGAVDQLRVYNRALTFPEVADLALP